MSPVVKLLIGFVVLTVLVIAIVMSSEHTSSSSSPQNEGLKGFRIP